MESTCTTQGKTWEECTLCKNTQKEQLLPLAEHVYGEEMKKEDGTYYKKCNNCTHEKVVVKEEGIPPVVSP